MSAHDRDARRADREEISEAVLRYARGVDRRDWPLVRSVYHADAYDDHGAFKGDLEGLMDWLQRRHAAIAKSMHFVTNILVEFDSADGAVAESYYIARQTMGPEAGESRLMLLGGKAASVEPGASISVEMAGRYIDRFERREGVWRIARRIVLFEQLQARVDDSIRLSSEWTRSRRDHTDALAEMRAGAGLPTLMN